MRLTTRITAFAAMLTGIAVFITLLGASWSFYQSVHGKVAQRMDAIMTLVDIDLLTHSPEKLGERLYVVMLPLDISRLTVLSGKTVVLDYEMPSGYLKTRQQYIIRTRTARLLKHPSFTVEVVYRDPINDYFHSLVTTAPLSTAIIFMIAMVLLTSRWIRRQFIGLEQMDNRAARILNGERGSEVLGATNEWPAHSSRALDMLLKELQHASEQRSRVGTLIRSYAAQDAQTGLNNRLFFESQLATLLEDREHVGAHGIVMMLRLPDFDILGETWGRNAVEEYLDSLINLLSTFITRYPGALLARYFQSDFAVLLPHSTLREADGIASQLLNSLDALPHTRMLDRHDMLHIGICTWSSGQTVDQVMEHAEEAARSATLQGSNGWAVYSLAQPDKGRGNVKWRTMLEDMMRRGGPRLYQKPAVMRDGLVHHREIMCRMIDGEQEVMPAEYMPLVQQFGLAEQYDRLLISRIIPLLRYWPEESLAIPVTVASLLHRPFQRWLRDTLMQNEKLLRNRILFELAEADVCQHISSLQPVIRLIKALGPRIVITQAGLTLVSTAYIQAFDPELIKLHPALVRNIDRRTENQLLVGSLVEACSGTRTRVMGVGTHTRGEWLALIEKGVSGAQGDFFVGPRPLDSNVKKYSHRYPV
jgi:RNase E specificity factor CsrD